MNGIPAILDASWRRETTVRRLSMLPSQSDPRQAMFFLWLFVRPISYPLSDLTPDPPKLGLWHRRARPPGDPKFLIFRPRLRAWPDAAESSDEPRRFEIGSRAFQADPYGKMPSSIYDVAILLRALRNAAVRRSNTRRSRFWSSRIW